MDRAVKSELIWRNKLNVADTSDKCRAKALMVDGVFLSEAGASSVAGGGTLKSVLGVALPLVPYIIL